MGEGIGGGGVEGGRTEELASATLGAHPRRAAPRAAPRGSPAPARGVALVGAPSAPPPPIPSPIRCSDARRVN